MAICPICRKKINRGTGDKVKIQGTWVHKSCTYNSLDRSTHRLRKKIFELKREIFDLKAPVFPVATNHSKG